MSLTVMKYRKKSLALANKKRIENAHRITIPLRQSGMGYQTTYYFYYPTKLKGTKS
jgi:hypothetical protein